MPQSTYNPLYNMGRIMGVVDGTTGADQLARPGQRVLVVDYLAQEWQELLNGIRFWSYETWRGEKIYTLCYRYHGTDATDRIVLAFNGLGSELELRAGMVLRVPFISEINRILHPQASNAGVRGQVIRV